MSRRSEELWEAAADACDSAQATRLRAEAAAIEAGEEDARLAAALETVEAAAREGAGRTLRVLIPRIERACAWGRERLAKVERAAARAAGQR